VCSSDLGLYLEDYSDENKDKIDYMIIYILSILVIVIVGIIFKKYPIFILTLPFIYLLLTKNDKDGGNSQAEYNSLRRRFAKYESLLKEREKTVEVLEILKKQDLSLFKDGNEMDFDFETYDNLKELEIIRRLEEGIKELRLKIHTLEKNLLSIDNILQKEAGLRDDLDYQNKRYKSIKDEIEAINLAKKTILEVADENRADIYKLNKKINRRIKKSIKELRLKIHTIEKNLLSIDNILQKEAGLRDDLDYQNKRYKSIKDEIEAINLAKKTILEVADENRADIYKLNKKIKGILNDTSKSKFDISFDKDLEPQIKDKTNFTYTEDQLSKGFFDQVNLAVKLSLV